jgi:hypothetical protein
MPQAPIRANRRRTKYLWTLLALAACGDAVSPGGGIIDDQTGLAGYVSLEATKHACHGRGIAYRQSVSDEIERPLYLPVPETGETTLYLAMSREQLSRRKRLFFAVYRDKSE